MLAGHALKDRASASAPIAWCFRKTFILNNRIFVYEELKTPAFLSRFRLPGYLASHVFSIKFASRHGEVLYVSCSSDSCRFDRSDFNPALGPDPHGPTQHSKSQRTHQARPRGPLARPCGYRFSRSLLWSG